MEPVAWAATVESTVAVLRTTVDSHSKVSSIEDDGESVPELAEEYDEDAWNVQVAEVLLRPLGEKALTIGVQRDEIGVETDFDNLESLLLGIGFEFGESNSFDGVQGDLITNGRLSTGTVPADLFREEHSLYMDIDYESDDDESFHRPSKRVRAASSESLIAQLG